MSAQLNVKIGYVPAIGSFDDINSLLDQYNAENVDQIETPFNSLNFLNGIDVGLRYKLGNVGFELDWNNMNRDRSALLYFENSDSFGSRLYKMTLNSFSLGIDSYVSRLGFGAGIHRQNLSIKREIGSNDLSLISQNTYAVDLHLNIKVQSGDIVSLIIKPYYRLPLSGYDLSPFGDDLLSSTPTYGNGKMDFYGLSLIFYNGRQ